MPRRVSEIITGIVVIAIALAFLGFAFTRTRNAGSGGYRLSAQFGHIGALGVGEAVKIGGVTIGRVVKTALNPQSYAAVVTFTVNNDIKIPKDSSAAIESASLLGGEYLSISPGASNSMLKPGQAIMVTQSAINVESLLGKFIFSAANMASSLGKQNGGGSGNKSADSLGKDMPSLGGQGGGASGQ